jgi:hypothetical protein
MRGILGATETQILFYRGRYSDREMTCEILRYNFLLVSVPSTKHGLQHVMKDMSDSFWSEMLAQRTIRVLSPFQTGP